jgi:hypothetical protein
MSRVFSVLCLVSLVTLWQGGGAKNIDPVGKWTFSTTNEEGNPTTGTIEISGKPGAYTGRITTSQGTTLQIGDVLSSSNVVLMLADLPDGNGTAVVKIIRSATGVYSGQWGALRGTIPARVERAK